MCTYFKTETDTAQNLIDDFFLTLAVRKDPSTGRISIEKKYGGTGILSEKMEALHGELNKREGAATSSYSAKVNFLQYIHFVLVAKNH